jgi:hypothetical protein
MSMKVFFWTIWILITLSVVGYFSYMMFYAEDKTPLLIGQTSYGHYQIEMACETCHTSAFGGEEVLQNACTQCHAEDLDASNDSHPKAKFTDPRNADLLTIIDARYCVSCHTEHHQDKTNPMGVTVPEDYCFHCHQEIAQERDSHKDLAFDSCATSGCHNFHDNRALYEGFLERHADEPIFNAIAQLPARTAEKQFKEKNPHVRVLTHSEIDLPTIPPHPNEVIEKINHEWALSAHARNGVECQSCHLPNQDNQWVEKPDHSVCQSCHKNQVSSFKEGKHGMRLGDHVSLSLPAVSPRDVLSSSPLSFKEIALDTVHSCTSCHGSHTFNTKTAAVEACLSCHNDEHSLAYLSSPHFSLWEKELSAELPENSGVTCASCHMHREVLNKKGEVMVVHNQNLTLRPNEKMIRPVCMNCHGLAFSIDALADPVLINNNFNGRPSQHIESIDWVKKRQ